MVISIAGEKLATLWACPTVPINPKATNPAAGPLAPVLVEIQHKRNKVRVRAGLSWAGPAPARAGLPVRGFNPPPPPRTMRGASWQGWKGTNQTPDLSSFLPGKAGTQTTGRVGSRLPSHPAWLWGHRPHSQGIRVAALPVQSNCDPLRGLHAEWATPTRGHTARAERLPSGAGHSPPPP